MKQEMKSQVNEAKNLGDAVVDRETGQGQKSGLVCTECPHVFTEAELSAEKRTAWGFVLRWWRGRTHPCYANVTDRFGPVPTACKSFRKPLDQETEGERILRRRRAFMPDYDKALEEWLS